MGGTLLFWGLLIVLAVQLGMDISVKCAQVTREMHVEAAWCAQEYIVNKCELRVRVPVAQEHCMKMEKCMAKSPFEGILKTTLWAELLAETLNSLLEPMAYRSLAVVLLIVLGVLLSLTKRGTIK